MIDELTMINASQLAEIAKENSIVIAKKNDDRCKKVLDSIIVIIKDSAKKGLFEKTIDLESITIKHLGNHEELSVKIVNTLIKHGYEVQDRSIPCTDDFKKITIYW